MNKKGFSLVELMVIIAIIGVLISIAVPSVNKYLAKRDALKMTVSEKKQKCREVFDYQGLKYPESDARLRSLTKNEKMALYCTDDVLAELNQKTRSQKMEELERAISEKTRELKDLKSQER